MSRNGDVTTQYKVIIRVSSSRDPDINPYTLTEEDTFYGVPTASEITEFARDVMDRFRDSWPFHRLAMPPRFEVDAEVHTVETVETQIHGLYFG